MKHHGENGYESVAKWPEMKWWQCGEMAAAIERKPAETQHRKAEIGSNLQR